MHLGGFLCIRDAERRGNKVTVYSGYKVADHSGLQDEGHINIIVFHINLVIDLFTTHHVAYYWASWWGKGGRGGGK